MILLRPISEHSTPHGYWDYKQPGPDGQYVEGRDMHFNRQSLKWLVKDVRQHREAMHATGLGSEQLDLRPDWQVRLFHDICSQANGKVPCEEFDTESGKSLRRWVGLTDIRRFIDIAREWVKQGGHWASRELAQERADICKACQHHQYVSCFGCKGILNEVTEMMGKPQSEIDTSLQGCAKCACSLSVKVYVPDNALRDYDKDVNYPSWCWRKDRTVTS